MTPSPTNATFAIISSCYCIPPNRISGRIMLGKSMFQALLMAARWRRVNGVGGSACPAYVETTLFGDPA
jgi:hypothetical protein